jgi:hypothetical protein
MLRQRVGSRLGDLSIPRAGELRMEVSLRERKLMDWLIIINTFLFIYATSAFNPSSQGVVFHYRTLDHCCHFPMISEEEQSPVYIYISCFSFIFTWPQWWIQSLILIVKYHSLLIRKSSIPYWECIEKYSYLQAEYLSVFTDVLDTWSGRPTRPP